MNAAALSPTERARLVSVLDRLGSDFAGERDAAALAAIRMLRGAGLTWDDVIQTRRPAPPARVSGHHDNEPQQRLHEVELCLRHFHLLTPGEQQFVNSVAIRAMLTVCQRQTLAEVVVALRKVGAT